MAEWKNDPHAWPNGRADDQEFKSLWLSQEWVGWAESQDLNLSLAGMWECQVVSAPRLLHCILHTLLFRHICTRISTVIYEGYIKHSRQHHCIPFFFGQGLADLPDTKTRARKSVLRPKSPGLLHCVTLYIHLMIYLSFIEITHNQRLKRLTHLQSQYLLWLLTMH